MDRKFCPTATTSLLHFFIDVLPLPYVPVRITRGTQVAHQYTYAPPRCRTSQYRRIFVPLSNDLADPVFDGVGLGGFKSRVNDFIGLSCSVPTIVFYYFSISLLSVYRLVLRAGVFGQIGCISLSLGLALPTSFINNYNNNNHKMERSITGKKKKRSRRPNCSSGLPFTWGATPRSNGCFT